MANWGETLARQIDLRIHAPVTNTAAITAIPAVERVHGMSILETTNGTTWWFHSTSTAAVGPSTLAPDSGSGRWLASSGGATGAGLPKMLSVRNATSTTLAAYTRTANVILADANGAIGAIDGVTNVVGDVILLKNGAAGADNGPYRIDALGSGSAKFQLTRLGSADASSEVVAGMLVYVSEGTAAGNEWWYLTTDDPITLNSTALTFVQVPSLVDLASTAAGHGASLIGVQATSNNLEVALAAVKATADAALGVVKRTVTITQAADLAGLGGGVKTFNKALSGGALPANSRFIGAVLHTFTGFQNVGDTATAAAILGSASGVDSVIASTSVRVGQTGFPKSGTLGVRGFNQCPLFAEVHNLNITSDTDLNTFTAGAVSADLFYIVIA